MPNDHLRAAMAQADLSEDDLADRVGVDIKTVRRWLNGRPAYARHRVKVAALLNVDELQLWPDQQTVGQPTDDRADLQAIYADASDIRAPRWSDLLESATRQIDLYDTTLSRILTTPGIPDLLITKARHGCRVRVLLSHPQSIWVTSLARQLDIHHTDDDGHTILDRELAEAHRIVLTLTTTPGIDAWTFWAERATSIYRFDDQMLVHHHAYAIPNENSALLHLRRISDAGLFAHHSAEIDRIIKTGSQPLGAGAE